MQKNVNIGGIWSVVELTEEEREQALSKLLEDNIKELLRCVRRVSTIDANEDRQNLVIKILFDKQATASFTALQDALDTKISNMRNSYKKPELPKEKEAEISKLVTEEMSHKTQERKPSLIDLAFSSVEKSKELNSGENDW